MSGRDRAGRWALAFCGQRVDPAVVFASFPSRTWTCDLQGQQLDVVSRPAGHVADHHPPPNRAVMTTGFDMQPATSSFLARLRHDQAGEGVISTAIAVLIMAIIGGAMWLAFNGVFETAETRITDEVNQIGS